LVLPACFIFSIRQVNEEHVVLIGDLGQLRHHGHVGNIVDYRLGPCCYHTLGDLDPIGLCVGHRAPELQSQLFGGLLDCLIDHDRVLLSQVPGNMAHQEAFARLSVFIFLSKVSGGGHSLGFLLTAREGQTGTEQDQNHDDRYCQYPFPHFLTSCLF
jgi:hypothetical protein